MANIYISPMASPSLECLSPAELANENSEQVEQVIPNQDENENDVFKGETNAFEKMRGYMFETPSSTLTTLRLSASSEDASQTSSLKRSPLYCFHSFTYGVGGFSVTAAGLHYGGKTTAELDGNDVCESESFDADSPNVWRTRMVVDPEESWSPTPTILHERNLGIEECPLKGFTSLEETTQTKPSEAFQAEIYVKLQNSNTAVKSVSNEATNAPKLLSLQGEDHSGTANGEKNCTKPLVIRSSSDGAESSVVNTHQTTKCSQNGSITSYIMVPSKRVISVHQRKDIAGSPSGVIMDIKDDCMAGEVVEEKEVVDVDCIPLIYREKSYTRYTIEKGLEEEKEEEEEEGNPVTCFPCRGCHIL